jgi:hypothetical protein
VRRFGRVEWRAGENVELGSDRHFLQGRWGMEQWEQPAWGVCRTKEVGEEPRITLGGGSQPVGARGQRSWVGGMPQGKIGEADGAPTCGPRDKSAGQRGQTKFQTDSNELK